MSIKYHELLEAINSNDNEEMVKTFLEIESKGKANGYKVYYFNVKFNANYADIDAEPVYKSLINIEIVKPEDETSMEEKINIYEDNKDAFFEPVKGSVKFSYINENIHQDKAYHSMTISEKDSPDFIQVFEFLDLAFHNGLLRLKDKLKNKETLSEEEGETLKALKHPDFTEGWTGYVPKSYKSKQTNKMVEVTDKQVRLNFNFRTWPAKMRTLKGPVSAIYMKRVPEEFAVKPNATEYKPIFIDDASNAPSKVMKYNSGSFIGTFIVPGAFKVHQGKISISAEVGRIFVTGNPKGPKAEDSYKNLYDAEEEEEILNAAKKSYNRTKPSNKKQAESDEDELDNLPKKKPPTSSKTAKKVKQESESEEEEPVKPVKKSIKKSTKKVESEEEEEVPKKSVKKSTKKVESDEEEVPKKSVKKTTKKEESDEEEAPKKSTKKPAKKPQPKEESSESEFDEE